MIRAKKNTEDKLDEENLDLSNTEEELDTDENDETEDLNKEKLDQLPVKQKPKCHECGWSFINNDKLRRHTSMIHAKKSDVDDDEMQEGDMKCNIC